ncbi:MAG: hypothetical protein HQK55_06940 [Deltaproteobacteria bacterium]|nr:hypothetical protein [Deltaproteobacteria bacterium]
MSTRTKTDPDAIRAELVKICAKRVRGDIREKTFQRTLAQRTVDLYRAVISPRLKRDETIMCEHHLLQSHFKIAQSVLREPEQMATSLFATDRRLIRLRSMVKPNSPVNCDESDQTVIDEIFYDQVLTVKVRRQIRNSQILAGLLTSGFAYVFKPYLNITGTVLIGFGILGVLHALVLPTRWVELVTADDSTKNDPMTVPVLHKKSGRALVRYIRARTLRV